MSFLYLLSIAALGVQIIFLLIFLIAFVRFRQATSAPLVPVSVIVAAHDEEKNIKELIPQLLAQEYPSFEIIIVEDRCNDETYDYLLQATKVHPQLKMVRVIHKPDHIQGKKFALTLGIKAAQHEWVLLTDADCRPTGNQWIAQMMQSRKESSQIILGFSPYQRKSGLLNAFIRFESLLTGVQFIGLALVGKPYMGLGRNLAYTKSLFIDNKGFPHLEVTGGDDDLFINKHATAKNVAISLGEGAAMQSEPKGTWSEFFVQKLRHMSVGKFYKTSDKLVLGLFMISGLLSWFAAVPALLLLNSYWLLGLMVLRLIMLTTLFGVAPPKLGGKFETWKTPFLDFIYAFYYLVTGLRALVVKKVQWKI